MFVIFVFVLLFVFVIFVFVTVLNLYLKGNYILGGAVLTWNWNGRLVSAGNMKVYTDDRIQVCRDADADGHL